MTEHIRTEIKNGIGFITLDRPQALNSLSLQMVRAIAASLIGWRGDDSVQAVVIGSSSAKAFCAGGDIRFFHEAGNSTPRGGSALLEDFFSEEYALNHLIHYYPKPYVAIMDGIVMGGGMGIAQSCTDQRLRIVTERTRMAMPEVNIGLFPDVGGGYFLSRLPGQLGTYLGVTGETIGADDALYAGLADVFIPAQHIPAMLETLYRSEAANVAAAIRDFAAPFREQVNAVGSTLSRNQAEIDCHFAHDSIAAVRESLLRADSEFARDALGVMARRSPLMMCVTLEQLRLSARMSVADCLRMERDMVRRCFEHGEVLEGIRALVIDKDNCPRWNPASLEEVTPEMVARLFESPWPEHAHPLRGLGV